MLVGEALEHTLIVVRASREHEPPVLVDLDNVRGGRRALAILERAHGLLLRRVQTRACAAGEADRQEDPDHR